MWWELRQRLLPLSVLLLPWLMLTNCSFGTKLLQIYYWLKRGIYSMLVTVSGRGRCSALSALWRWKAWVICAALQRDETRQGKAKAKSEGERRNALKCTDYRVESATTCLGAILWIQGPTVRQVLPVFLFASFSFRVEKWKMYQRAFAAVVVVVVVAFEPQRRELCFSKRCFTT